MMALLGLTGAEQPLPKYAEGQVWEYKTRPGDEGSLLKIQSIENLADFASSGPVHHISIIGVHFQDRPMNVQNLPHLPVSRSTLDASVTHLSISTVEFPDPRDGIEYWRAARGGVFTVPVAEVVSFVEHAMQQRPTPK